MNTLLLTIIGYTASVCMVLGYLPQAIATIRTRSTDGIALPTFCMLGLGSIFFVIQGIMLENWPLVITNVITTICSVIIFGIKINNDRRKKR
jgi:MtN3 and saliva related transmembrane protein